jgi:flagellar export protein FliJ
VKRFEFHLQRVLQFKERNERLAEARQQAALADLQRCEAEMAALGQQLHEVATSQQTQPGKVLNLAGWLTLHRKAEQLRQALLQAEQQTRQARVRYAQASRERRDRAVEAEALRKLRQRQSLSHREAVEHAEQVALDDIGLRRWQAENEA